MKEEIRNEIVEQDMLSVMENFPPQQVCLRLSPAARFKLRGLSELSGMNMSTIVTQWIDHSFEKIRTMEHEFSPKEIREMNTTMKRIGDIIVRDPKKKKGKK